MQTTAKNMYKIVLLMVAGLSVGVNAGDSPSFSLSAGQYDSKASGDSEGEVFKGSLSVGPVLEVEAANATFARSGSEVDNWMIGVNAGVSTPGGHTRIYAKTAYHNATIAGHGPSVADSGNGLSYGAGARWYIAGGESGLYLEAEVTETTVFEGSRAVTGSVGWSF